MTCLQEWWARGAACLCALLLTVAPVAAVEPDEVLDDPVLEERARDLSRELRCLVCRNESIDESSASVAKDLRLLVRERLVAGDSDEAVLAYIVDRYGEFVLLNPPASGSTLILWGAPLALLLLGGGVAISHVRRQRGATGDTLSPEEEARLAQLMDEDAKG